MGSNNVYCTFNMLLLLLSFIGAIKLDLQLHLTAIHYDAFLQTEEEFIDNLLQLVSFSSFYFQL